MRKFAWVAVAILGTAVSALAFADLGKSFKESLNGLKEAPNIVSTTGTGTFSARVSDDESAIDYELTFDNLEDNVLMAHIHVGHPQNSGGIVLWLCGSAAQPGPAGTPLCADPANPRQGVVSGTLTAANVQNLGNNGIAGPTATTAGEFAEVVALIRAGKTYVNVHSLKFPAGEIRSQIDRQDGNDDHASGNH